MFRSKKLTEYNALNLPHSTPILSNNSDEIIIIDNIFTCRDSHKIKKVCRLTKLIQHVTQMQTEIVKSYFPPSIPHAFMPLLLKVPIFHIRPAGMTTPAVWTNELTEAFVESTTAPGSLFKTSMGWSLLLPTCIMTEEAGTALHLHSMKRSRSETAIRSTRWQLGRAVEDDETRWHIICSFT